MRLLEQPNRWSCLPTSLAMATGIGLREILEAFGHDGSEIVYPNLPEPLRRRSFHIQEVVEVALALGYMLTPIERQPLFVMNPEAAFDALGVAIDNNAHGNVIKEYYAAVKAALRAANTIHSLEHYLARHDGIITGIGTNGRPHAMAWHHVTETVYCPSGRRLLIKDVEIYTLWIVKRTPWVAD